MEIFNELLTRIRNANKFVDINPKFVCKHCFKDLNASFYLNPSHVKKFIKYNNYICKLKSIYIEPGFDSDKIQQIYIKLVDLKHYKVKIEADDDVKDKELFDLLSKIDYYQTQDPNRNVTNENFENSHFQDTKDSTQKNSKLDDNVTATKKLGYSTEQLLFCKICKSKFKNVLNLNAHVLTHKYKHCCSTCGIWFVTKEELKKHTVSHKKLLYSCLMCKKRFQTEMRRRQHMLTHVKNRPHSCPTCGRRFATKRHLSIHSLTHKKKVLIPRIEQVDECYRTVPLNRTGIHKKNTLKKHTCSTCEKCFVSKYHLNRHKIKHSLHLCPHCGKIFKTKGALRIHTMCHSDKLNYLCSICGKRYNSIGSLNTHMESHKYKRSYTCATCGKSFKYRVSIIKHVRSHKNGFAEERSFICATCEKCFKSKGDLQYHVLIHLNERQHKCVICEKSFNRKSDLKRHMLTHTKQYLYHCSTCGSSFSRKYYLTRHMLIHTNIQQCKCSYCGKITKDSFKQHMLVHTIKQYACSDCGKAFRRKYILTRHKCTKQAKKNLKNKICPICEKQFNHRNILNEHIKSHNDKSFYCPTCKWCFNNKAAVEKHMLRHTKERRHHCLICEKCYFRIYHLRRHLKMHVKEYSESCKTCMTILKYRTEDVMSHVLTHKK